MIIVKTTNGAKFVNEKEAVMVCHDKKAKQVSFHTRETMQGVTINDVESVTFITDTQAVEWKDEGSELEKLKAKYDEHMEWSGKLRDEYMKMDTENSQLKSEVEKLRNLVKTMEGMNQASAPKQKISLRATSPVGSDCTQAFDVDGCDGMAVNDFILAVIKNDPFVTIDIMRGGKYIWKGEYENNILKKEYDNTMPEDFNFLKVKSARAAGGWGQMSYHVKLYDPDSKGT